MFPPEKERRRAWLRGRLGTYNERAQLIMDGLKCHMMEPSVELLRRHNVTVLLLVAHSSHMTQPLDVGIFWRVKNLIRADTKYLINLRILDQAVAEQTEAETRGEEIPSERGRLLAEFVLKILRSFEQATVPDNVVSAFAQVGIHFDFVDPNNTDRRVCYVDPATARVIVAKFVVITIPGTPRRARRSMAAKDSGPELPWSVGDGARAAPRARGHPRGAPSPTAGEKVTIEAQLTYRQAARAARPRPAAPGPRAPPRTVLHPPRAPAAPRDPGSAFRRARSIPTRLTHRQRL